MNNNNSIESWRNQLPVGGQFAARYQLSQATNKGPVQRPAPPADANNYQVAGEKAEKTERQKNIS